MRSPCTQDTTKHTRHHKSELPIRYIEGSVDYSVVYCKVSYSSVTVKVEDGGTANCIVRQSYLSSYSPHQNWVSRLWGQHWWLEYWIPGEHQTQFNVVWILLSLIKLNKLQNSSPELQRRVILVVNVMIKNQMIQILSRKYARCRYYQPCSLYTKLPRKSLKPCQPETSALPVRLLVVNNLNRFDGPKFPEVILEHSLICIAGSTHKDLATIFITHFRFQRDFGNIWTEKERIRQKINTNMRQLFFQQ